MTDEPVSDVQVLARLLQLPPTPGGGRGRHSPLYWWMFTRADELRPIFERSQTAWADVAAALPDTADIRDGAGKRPTGDRLRKTWHEVREAKGWKVAKPVPATATTPAQPVRPPTAATENPENEFGFSLGISPKRWTNKPE
jgi:hypothetical protein